MAGTKQHTDHSPEKTAKASQEKALAHPGVYGEIDLVHELFNTKFCQGCNDGFFSFHLQRSPQELPERKGMKGSWL